jgi:hypothetical protein
MEKIPQNFEPKFEMPAINIDSALNLIQTLENKTDFTSADGEEINYMVKSLQDLQNSGLDEPTIQVALTKLINLRESYSKTETLH